MIANIVTMYNEGIIEMSILAKLIDYLESTSSEHVNSEFLREIMWGEKDQKSLMDLVEECLMLEQEIRENNESIL